MKLVSFAGGAGVTGHAHAETLNMLGHVFMLGVFSSCEIKFAVLSFLCSFFVVVLIVVFIVVFIIVFITVAMVTWFTWLAWLAGLAILAVIIAVIAIANFNLHADLRVDIDPVLGIVVDWGEINVHDIAVTTNHIFELFVFLFHIVLVVIPFSRVWFSGMRFARVGFFGMRLARVGFTRVGFTRMRFA